MKADCVPLQLRLTSFPKAYAAMPDNSFISVPSRSGAGFAMTGNTIQNGRGNGCIGRANSGLISGNVVINMAYNGVEVGPSFGAREGSFSTNVMVRCPEIHSVKVMENVVRLQKCQATALYDLLSVSEFLHLLRGET